MSNLETTVQSLDIGSIVDLYHINLVPAGFTGDFYFTPSSPLGTNITFGGIVYVARPIQITGFSKSSADSPPEPTLSLSNVDKGGTSLLETYNDLLGARITRIRTFAQFLDFLPDGVTANPNADSTAYLPPEVWYINQKQNANRRVIQWRLKSSLDLAGLKIPNRLILKNVCKRTYRVWDSVNSVFIYATKNACPYTGVAMFQHSGATTNDPTLDVCAKDFSACKLRFGTDALPGWFFPGASRLPSR